MGTKRDSKTETSNHASASSENKGKDKPGKKNKKGEGIEEFIDPDPHQKGDKKKKPDRHDGMGISEKAKRQSSDESDVARGKS